nr:immunoglobulin light chain junction region [Macaca mulatta]
DYYCAIWHSNAYIF